MADSATTIVVAVIGAFGGSAAGVYLGSVLDRQRDAHRARETLVQRHLVLFQEAVEALWFRLENLAKRRGRAVMNAADPHYWEITTLYALGTALAAERLIALEGVRPQLNKAWPQLGRVLLDQRIDQNFKAVFGDDVFHYEIRTVAEATLVPPDGAGVRLRTYIEFRQVYENDTDLGPAFQRVISALADLDKEQYASLMQPLARIAHELASVTEVPTKTELG